MCVGTRAFFKFLRYLRTQPKIPIRFDLTSATAGELVFKGIEGCFRRDLFKFNCHRIKYSGQSDARTAAAIIEVAISRRCCRLTPLSVS